MKDPWKVVEVQDSPPLSRYITSPMPSMPQLAKRRAEMCAFMRGGARVRGHRMRMTCTYNPHQRHHCACVCVLRAIQKKTARRGVVKLREDTAK